LGEKTNSPLSLVWSNAPKGTHVLKALATDDRGATNSSVLVNITVSNTPPTIALTSPTNGSVFIEGDVIPLSATAGDVDGTNVLVEFLAGTNRLAALTNEPYTFNWSNALAGAYALTARTVDNDNATNTSS